MIRYVDGELRIDFGDLLSMIDDKRQAFKVLMTDDVVLESVVGQVCEGMDEDCSWASLSTLQACRLKLLERADEATFLLVKELMYDYACVKESERVYRQWAWMLDHGERAPIPETIQVPYPTKEEVEGWMHRT